ncbi:hypothetical protein F5Y19DRAFT_378381 [Xylariaceae sp. FL1651]|nr:hypothetical protein F5Y19DRAFT_378381 [Xylariaceae sp. FL1651]
MGQSFQLVAPRAKLALSWSGKLGEILFDGSARDLVCLLAVPVRRQHDSPQNASVVDSTDTICEEKRGAKRIRDDDNVHAESPRCRKQTKVQARDKKAVSNTVVPLSNLPLELHRLIFSFVEDMEDLISLSITNQHFLSIGRECLEDYYTSHFGRWAGTNVVCVGHDVEPNDYLPGLFSNEELEVLRQETTDVPDDWEYPDEGDVRNKPFTLEHFTYPTVSMIEKLESQLFSITCSLAGSCIRRGISEDPAFFHIRPQFRVTNETYFPTDQHWILRNLTMKQIVRSDAIALSPDYISGPNIQVLGFGEVVMSRICWSISSSVSMKDPTNISRGVWAGHCFDITTLSRHKAETLGEEWRDVSEEVAKEIASIWEGEYGANWRETMCKS